MRDSEQQLQAVMDMSQAGIFMTNTSRWTILYANNRMAELFGYTLPELDGSATAYLSSDMESLISQADKRMYEDKWTNKLTGKTLSSYCPLAEMDYPMRSL